jgi:hypothetical protein
MLAELRITGPSLAVRSKYGFDTGLVSLNADVRLEICKAAFPEMIRVAKHWDTVTLRRGSGRCLFKSEERWQAKFPQSMASVPVPSARTSGETSFVAP